MHFSKNHQGTLRNKVYHSQVLEGTRQAPGPHCEVMEREGGREGGSGGQREREIENLAKIRGSAFVRVQGWGV